MTVTTPPSQERIQFGEGRLNPIVVDRTFLVAEKIEERLAAVRAALQLHRDLGGLEDSGIATAFATSAAAYLQGRHAEVPFAVCVLDAVERTARQLQPPTTRDVAKAVLLLALDNLVISFLGRYEHQFMRLQRARLAKSVGYQHGPDTLAIDALADAVHRRCVRRGKPPAVHQFVQDVLSDKGVGLLPAKVKAGTLKRTRSRTCPGAPALNP